MKKILILFIVITSLSIAQVENSFILSGSLVNDTKYALIEINDSSKSYNINVSQNKKNPIITGLMSFAVPGAGQIYIENYLKAGVFVAIEIGAIILATTYDKKGDDQTVVYKNFANKYWDVGRYAKWTLKNLSSLNLNLDPNDYHLFNNEGNVIWSELNRMEGAIGWYYSHKLERFGEQQYYEMIGKYSQFNVGWEMFGDENTEYDYNNDSVVEQFKYYSKERGKANEFYNVAKWAVVTIVSNHIISALDAAWSASRYNKKLNFTVSIEEETIGFYKDYYPQLNFNYNF